MDNPEEDADVWQQLEDGGDAGGVWSGYIAIEETPSTPQCTVNGSTKTVDDSSEPFEQENIVTNRQVLGDNDFIGYNSTTNSAECGSGDVLKRSADPESSPVKRQATGSGGYVAFA